MVADAAQYGKAEIEAEAEAEADPALLKKAANAHPAAIGEVGGASGVTSRA